MQDLQQKMIYFHENFSAKDVDESLVGRKGLSLFSLKDVDVPVAPFFVISPLLYNDLIYKAFANRISFYLKEKKLPDPLDIKGIIHETEFSPEAQEELLKSYAKLSGFSRAWVAVRSSVVYLPNGNVLFPGVFGTEVNVRGYDDLVAAIKNVYASVFTDSVVNYARQHGVDLKQLRMSVVVQKMVQAEVSGVTYTKDLITQDSSKMSIEAVFGLGDVISRGEITPDRYVFNKEDLSFVEKTISPQDWMSVRSLNTKGTGGIEKIAISSAWSHRQKLEDKALRDIAKTCLLIEDSFGADQNIEWVWESGKVWIIQHKSLYVPSTPQVLSQQFAGINILEPILGVLWPGRVTQQFFKPEQNVTVARQSVQTEMEVSTTSEKHLQPKEVDTDSKEKLEKLSEKFTKLSQKQVEQTSKAAQKKTDQIIKKREKVVDNVAKSLLEDNLDVKNLEFLLTGIGVSTGTKVGQVIHVNSQNYKNLVISREHIILIDEVFEGLRDVIYRAGGVLMDKGGITSDVAIQCRESAIPAVVGTGEASRLLKNEDFVKIDSGSGGVYVYGKQTAPKRDKEEKATSQKSNDSGEIEYEIIDKEDGYSHKPKSENTKNKPCTLPSVEIQRTATKVYLSDDSLKDADEYILKNSDGLVFCDLEKLMIEEDRHPLAFVEEDRSAEYVSTMAKKVSDFSNQFSDGEVIVSLGSHRSVDFLNLVKGKSHEKVDDTRGVSRYLTNSDLAKLALKIIARVRNVHRCKNISLAFHSPLNGENMKAIKKKVLAAGLRRGSSFKFYAVIENATEIILLEDILAAGIDGLVLNTPTLAKQMQGVSIYDEKAVYSLESNSLFKTLEDVRDKQKAFETQIIGITNDEQLLLKKYIEFGFPGVVVSSERFVEMKKIISEKETEIILSKGRI
jgi:phosphoenolpyruvate synthase/pyruvate phosphate dikinase